MITHYTPTRYIGIWLSQEALKPWNDVATSNFMILRLIPHDSKVFVKCFFKCVLEWVLGRMWGPWPCWVDIDIGCFLWLFGWIEFKNAGHVVLWRWSLQHSGPGTHGLPKWPKTWWCYDVCRLNRLTDWPTKINKNLSKSTPLEGKFDDFFFWGGEF